MLTNAVNVKLRGNTRMVMRNNMNVALTRGSAEFVCPTDANGFTVHLPDNSRVVDLGTAFRVAIDDDRRAKLVVTDGKVKVAARGRMTARPHFVIRRGQGIHIIEGRVAPMSYAETICSHRTRWRTGDSTIQPARPPKAKPRRSPLARRPAQELSRPPPGSRASTPRTPPSRSPSPA